MDPDAVKSIYWQSVGVAQITIKEGGTKPVNAVEKVLTVGESIYILYANGTWKKKEK